VVTRARGFTLVELMIAMALALVGLLGLLALQSVASSGNLRAKNFTEATGLAQDRVEQLQALPYAQIAADYTTWASHKLVESGLGPMGVAVANGLYSRTTTLSADAVIANAYDVRVDVQWSGEDGTGTVNGSLATKHQVSLFDVRAP
jgi:prepilin-type N-terminal cleavage/methylation domain-containing protein